MHFFKEPKEHSTVLTKRFTLYEAHERCGESNWFVYNGFLDMGVQKCTINVINSPQFNFNFFLINEKKSNSS